MSQRFYRPELDALRLFAFVCVFSSHIPIGSPWFVSFAGVGSFGVSVFFLLSAYLIVTILLREKEATGTIRLRSFAARRVLRIWPLYFFVLFLDYFIGVRWPGFRVPGRAVLAFSVLAGNIYVAMHGWVADTVNALWSLSVEEQFYLVIPAVARFGGRRGILTLCAITIPVAYLALVWLGIHGALPLVGVWANSFVQFQFFAAGGILAILLDGRKLTLSLVQRAGIATLGLGLWCVASFRFHLYTLTPSHPAQLVSGYSLLLVGTIAIFLAIVDIGARVPAFVIFLGKISYGLYLFHRLWLCICLQPIFHTPVTDFFAQHDPLHRVLGTLAALMATILTSMLSYRYFERPILRFKHRFEAVRTRPD